MVKPSSTPGVCVEKERISKVTADMKGCYALVYRRQNEENSAIPEVPKHLLDDIAGRVGTFSAFICDLLFLIAVKVSVLGSRNFAHVQVDQRICRCSSVLGIQ